MDAATLLNLGGYTAVTVIGAVLSFFWHQLNAVRSELNTLKLHLAGDYVRKDDYKEDIRELKESIRLVFDKIDKLVETRNAL